MTRLGRSYMPVGLTSDPTERGSVEKGYLTREAHPIDMIRFMAWSVLNSENHEVVVFNNQEHNYRVLHGMNMRTARKSSSAYANEKRDMLKRMVDENGINAQVYDSNAQFASSAFQDSLHNLEELCKRELAINQMVLGLVPAWIKDKARNDPKKVQELSQYALGELAYIIMRADEVKVGHNMERTYDSCAKNLVQEGFVKSSSVPSFAYPFSSGMRLTSDRPIEPYRVPNNPGARSDRIFYTDSPMQARVKIDAALKSGAEVHVKKYLQMVKDTASMISPQSGTIMSWLPELADQYLTKLEGKEAVASSNSISFKEKIKYSLALAASTALFFTGAHFAGKLVEKENNRKWMEQYCFNLAYRYPLSNSAVLPYVAPGKKFNQLNLRELERAANLMVTEDIKDEISKMNNPDYKGLMKYKRRHNS